MLQSDLCDYNDAYIADKGIINVQTKNNGSIDGYDRNLILKNSAPFISCISKISNILIDNSEDLDVIMPMYNLIKYNKNYRKTTGSLQNYYNDISIDLIKNPEYWKYKTRITGKTANDGNTKEIKFSVLLKHLCNFWRLDMPLINCEVPLTLIWSEKCVIADKKTQDVDLNGNSPRVEIRAPAMQLLKQQAQNCMYQLLHFQLKMIINYQSN